MQLLFLLSNFKVFLLLEFCILIFVYFLLLNYIFAAIRQIDQKKKKKNDNSYSII